MKEQIPLTIQFDEILNFENFLIGQNKQAVKHLISLHHQHSQSIFLHGTSGIGKTHLAQAVFHQYNNNDKLCGYVDASEEGIQPMMLEGLQNFDCLIMDGIDSIIEDISWQEAIFHAFNRFIQKGGNILFSALESPKAFESILPDLSSRFLSGYVFQLVELSDEEKLLALQNRALEFGLGLPTEVGQFWLTHGSRDNAILFSQLRELDSASLSHKRKLTIPFLKQELDL